MGGSQENENGNNIESVLRAILGNYLATIPFLGKYLILCELFYSTSVKFILFGFIRSEPTQKEVCL